MRNFKIIMIIDPIVSLSFKIKICSNSLLPIVTLYNVRKHKT